MRSLHRDAEIERTGGGLVMNRVPQMRRWIACTLACAAVLAPTAVTGAELPACSAWNAEADPVLVPGIRDFAQDPVRNVIIAVGGDTWELQQDLWVRREIAGPQPPIDGKAVTAFDPVRRVVVLIGRGSTPESRVGWEYDGASWTTVPALWSDVAAVGGFIAFDSRLGAIVSVDRTARVRVYRDGAWSEAPAAAPEMVPLSQDGFRGDFSPERGSIVVVYHETIGTRRTADISVVAQEDGTFRTTWTLDSIESNTPMYLYGNRSVWYDPALGTMCCRSLEWNGVYKACEFRGSSWHCRATDRWDCLGYGSATFVDRVSGRTIIVANRFSQGTSAVAFALENGHWREIGGTVRRWHGSTIGVDPLRGQVLAVGGDRGCNPAGSDSTFLRDGTIWRELKVMNRPPPRRIAALVFDELAGELLYFSGAYELAGTPLDTWAWTGTDWVLRDPGTFVYGAGCVAGFDPVTGRVIRTFNSGFNTQAWTGSSWIALTGTTTPAAIVSMSVDRQINRLRAITRGPAGRLFTWNGYQWLPDSPAAWRCPADTAQLLEPQTGSPHGLIVVANHDVLAASVNGVFHSVQSSQPGFTPGEFPNFHTAVVDPLSGVLTVFDRSGPAETGLQTVATWNGVVGVGITKSPVVTLGSRPGGPLSIAADYVPNGTDILSVRWELENNPIAEQPPFSGVHTTRLNINPVTTAEHGTYRFVIETGCGPVVAGSVTLPFQFLCPGDANGNGFFDTGDLAILIPRFGFPAEVVWFDPDGSGVFDTPDLVYFIARFGAPCPSLP